MFVMLGALLFQAGWQITQRQDPITDRLEATAILKGDNASIVFTCGGSGKPMVRYEPGAFLGGRGHRYALRDFIYRFDGQPAERESWKYLDTYAAPYSTKASVAFVTRMIQSKQLVIRAERYDGRLIDSTFDLAGSAEAFHQAFGLCGIR